MANVLNKITKVYLQSVNTPEYPESDWIINPDLSAVAGVPSCYWRIVERVVVDEPARDETDPDTLEVTHIPAIEHTEYDIVEMTAEEKAVVDAGNTRPVTNRLADGTMAYLYKGIHVISVNVFQLVFSVSSLGAKKFTVPFQSANEAFTCDRDRLLTRVSVSTAGTFSLVMKVNGLERTRFAVGEDRSFPDLELRLNAGERLSFAVEAEELISSPVITVDTGYID